MTRMLLTSETSATRLESIQKPNLTLHVGQLTTNSGHFLLNLADAYTSRSC